MHVSSFLFLKYFLFGGREGGESHGSERGRRGRESIVARYHVAMVVVTPGLMSGMESPRLEGTLAIIKPDAFSRRIEIEEIIMKEGFLLVEKKRLRFTRSFYY